MGEGGREDRSPVPSAFLTVCDFSPRASARYMETVCDGDRKFLRSMRSSVRKQVLPWELLHFSDSGHDSVGYFVVKASLPPDLAKVWLKGRITGTPW